MVRRGARVGAAAFVLGLSLSGPQMTGVAHADAGEPTDTGAQSVSAPDDAGPKVRSGRRVAQRATVAQTDPTITAPAAAAAPRRRVGADRADLTAPRPAAGRHRTQPALANSVLPPVLATGSGSAQVEPAAAAGPVSTVPKVVVVQAAAAAAAPLNVPALRQAAPAQPMAMITVAVNNFFASAAKWVTSLPAGPVSEFLQGALLLVRRTLFGFVPSAGSGTGGSHTVSSPYMTDQQLQDYLLELAKQRYGSLFGQTVPYYGYYPQYKLDGPGAVAGGVTSDTNTQVEGVDEADFVETDGHYIYVANSGGLTILDSDSHLHSQTSLSGSVVGQYLSGDRLTVITQSGGGWYGPYVKMAPGYFWDWNPQTTVTVYDVSDRTAPTVASQNIFDGSYRDSRAVDGIVYVVVDRDVKLPAPQYVETYPEDPQEFADIEKVSGPQPVSYRTYETWDAYLARVGGSITTTALPHAYSVDAEGNQVDLGATADAAHIVRPQGEGAQSLLTVVSLDSHNTAGTSAFAGGVGTFLSSGGGTVYMTPESLYVATSSSDTRIDRFTVDGTTVDWQASGVVTGTLINQFAMDEKDGYLRVATHTFSSQFAGGTWATVNENGVYVLDTAGDTLDVVGSVTGLAPGEQLYAVRYVGDTAYLVTFLRTDPLFAIDLSNPAAPVVEGELVIPGFSNYLQSVGDGLLLGIGQEREAGTWNTRVHVSLFDVSDGANLTQIERQFLDEDSQWSWSQAQFDHHAVLYSPEDGLLVVPVSGNSDQILSVLRVGADGITTLGEIHTEQPVLRTVRIGDVLYAVSETEVTAYRLSDLSLIGRTPLGEPRYGGPIYAQ